ncbi:hypothetical protein [Marinilabilia salmonicolor]|jgi:hypothetical protein|nr:hypothetical protein [Marinilabilia salmonicolor]
MDRNHLQIFPLHDGAAPAGQKFGAGSYELKANIIFPFSYRDSRNFR